MKRADLDSEDPGGSEGIAATEVIEDTAATMAQAALEQPAPLGSTELVAPERRAPRGLQDPQGLPPESQVELAQPEPQARLV
jgi:hypothetical protein